MVKVKLEVFLSTSNDQTHFCLSNLLGEIIEEYHDRLAIVTYIGQNELFYKYHLASTPAIVIEEMIKIVGFCPSKETLISALTEFGL